MDIPAQTREKCKTLSFEEIRALVYDTESANDDIRYNAFRLLLCRSEEYCDVYPYCKTFAEKLKSVNSYQRTIGFMLLAVNSKWDKDNIIENNLNDFLDVLNDEKPITVRQCVQSLKYIIPYKKNLLEEISSKLMSTDITAIKETMRKLVLLDILNALIEIKQYSSTEKINAYILNALSGGILDVKLKKQIQASLK